MRVGRRVGVVGAIATGALVLPAVAGAGIDPGQIVETVNVDFA